MNKFFSGAVAGFVAGAAATAYGALCVLDKIIPGTKKMLWKSVKKTMKEVIHGI